MEKKLVCKKCGGTEFDAIEHGAFTVDPPIPYTVYRCAKCGAHVTVESYPQYVAPNHIEVIMNDNDRIWPPENETLAFDGATLTSITTLTTKKE